MVNEIVLPLSAKEKQDLEKLEARIEKCFTSFVKDLKEIRDRRLYREQYGTWENYLEERWDRTRMWAHFEIHHYEVCEKLKGVNESLLPSKAESRALAVLEKDAAAMERAMREAQNIATRRGQRRTADIVREAVDMVTGRTEERLRKRKKLEQLKKQEEQITEELSVEDSLPDLLPSQAADQEEQQQEEQQEEQQTPEQSVVSVALTFIEAKLTEQQLAITVEQTVKLLESLGIELTSIKVR